MFYISTRDTSASPVKVTAAEAIKKGLAPDKGLYMPTSIPALPEGEIERLAALPYNKRAADILAMFLDDYNYDELLADCTEAYSEARFPGGAAPLVHVHDNIYSLELWHGPTCAFKDLALQILPYLLTTSAKKIDAGKIVILVATSGLFIV